MKHKVGLALTSSAFFVSLATAAFAETPAPPDQKEESVFDVLAEEREVMVTTGTRIATKQSEVPSSVWVIDRQAIENSGALTITDLLRQVPGLAILNTTNSDSIPVARGFAASPYPRILVLIDGRSLLSEDFGVNYIQAIDVDIYDLERIEVVLGPANTLYGVNAFDGVINLITKKPGEKREAFASIRGGIEWSSVGGNAPSLGKPGPLGSAYASYSDKITGTLSLRVSAFGNYIAPVDILPVPTPYRLYADPFGRAGGNLDLTWRQSKWDFRAQFSGIYSNADDWSDAFEKDQINNVSLNLVAKRKALLGSDDELSFQLWGRYLYENTQIPVASIPTLTDIENAFSTELYTQYISPEFFHNRIVGGLQLHLFDLNYEEGSSAVLPANSEFQQFYSVFAEDQFRPWRPLILTLGVRVQDREAALFRAFSHVSASPHAAIVVVPTEGQSIRVEYSTSYRDPSAAEFFTGEKILNGAVTAELANPHLQQEHNQLLTLGYRGKFAWLEPRVEGFYGRKDNMILNQNSGLPPPDQLASMFVNAGNVDYFGATAWLGAKPTKDLEFFADYTFTQYRALTRIVLSGGLIMQPGQAFDDSPRHIAGIGGRWMHGRWTASLQGYFQSASYFNYDSSSSNTLPTADASITINAMLGFFVDSAHRWQLVAAGTNIPDIRIGTGAARDLSPYDVARIGPRGWLEVRFRWN